MNGEIRPLLLTGAFHLDMAKVSGWTQLDTASLPSFSSSVPE